MIPLSRTTSTDNLTFFSSSFFKFYLGTCFRQQRNCFYWWGKYIPMSYLIILLFFNAKTRNLHDFYLAQNGSRFRVKCFFLGSTSVTYYGLFYCIIWFVMRHCWRLIEHNWICIAPVFLNILFEFQVIRKGCIFSPFLPFVLLFLRSCCIHSRITSLLLGTIDKQSKRKIFIIFETGSASHCEGTVEWAIAIAI